MTQEDLAFQSGLHQAQIYRLEAGKRLFNSDQLEKISVALGVPVINLFPKELVTGENSNYQNLVEIISRIPDEKQKDLAEFLLNVIDEDIDIKTLKEDFKIVNMLRKHFSS